LKILYGVQATGNGHFLRSNIIIKELRKKGHNVSIIFSGGDKNSRSRINTLYPDFKPYTYFNGLTFSTDKGKIKYLKTVKDAKLINMYKDIKSFDNEQFDLVITDFEPISSRIAKRKEIPSIGIGHQYAFIFDIPKYKKNPIANTVLRYFAPADYNVGLHWNHFDQPVLPPIINKINIYGKKEIKNKILVYLPWEDNNEVQDFLSCKREYDFHVYSNIDADYEKDNVYWHPFSRKKFLEDLVTSSGVISNAGFEFPSEVLSIGKRLLVKPQIGQTEQLSNAEALKRLDLATTMDYLDKDTLKKWVDSKKNNLEHFIYDVAPIVNWIVNMKWDNIDELMNKYWNNN